MASMADFLQQTKFFTSHGKLGYTNPESKIYSQIEIQGDEDCEPFLIKKKAVDYSIYQPSTPFDTFARKQRTEYYQPTPNLFQDQILKDKDNFDCIDPLNPLAAPPAEKKKDDSNNSFIDTYFNKRRIKHTQKEKADTKSSDKKEEVHPVLYLDKPQVFERIIIPGDGSLMTLEVENLL